MAESLSDEFDGEGMQYNGTNGTKSSHKTQGTRGVKRNDMQHDDNGPFAKHQRIVEDVPSTQELIYMKETKALYHNSFFRIQLETLLSEITLKSKHKLALDKWIQNFADYLLALPAASDAVPLSDWSSYSEEGVHTPLLWCPRVEGTFHFAAPAAVSATGSYADGSITTLSKIVDLKLVVPESCLEAGDHRDGRWLLKRAHFLAHLAVALQSCPLVAALQWSRHLDEPLRPTLLVSPKLGGGAGKWQLRLLPVPAAAAFKVHAFSPQKLNIRYKGEVSCARLNFLCGVDTAMSDNCTVLENTLPAMPGLLQAVKLIKVWLRQRHLSEGRGAVTGHVVAMLVLYLFRMRRVNAQMSAYQVFRVLLNYIENECEWQTKGVSLYELSKSSDAPNPYANTVLPVAGHHAHYPVVFVDPSGYLNITATLSLHTLLRVKQEAKLSLAVLSSNSAESFESLFIQRTDFHLTFDQSLVVRVCRESLEQYYSLASTPVSCLLVNQLHPSVFPGSDESDESDDEAAVAREMHPMVDDVCELLKKGLGDRAFLVAPQLAACGTWAVDQPAPLHPESMLIGLRLNPISAFSLLIKDTANQPTEFREFWGELSSLRRFRDGTSCESVAFGDGSEGAGDCRRIPGKLAKHLLSRHLHIPRTHVHHVGPRLEDVLRLPKDVDEHLKYSTGEGVCAQACKAYEDLCNHVRRLDVNLSVTGFACSAPVVASCDVFPRQHVDPLLPKSMAFKLLETPNPIEVFVTLERSGKWPDGLARVNCLKRGFHCRMVNQLLKQGFTATLAHTHLLVAVRGWVFAVEVTYQGEVALLRQLGSQEQEQDERDEDESLKDTPASIERQIATAIAPRISSALSGLSRQYPSYSGAVRLCRRWLSSQLLEPHIPSIVTQLLVAHLYLCPGQYEVPHTPSVGLLRFLSLLANTNFLTTPFFMSVGEKFHALDKSELQQRFNQQRSTLPPLVLVTPYDIRGSLAKLEADGIENVSRSTLEFRYGLVSHCTRDSPDAHVLALSKVLAARCLASYTEGCLQPSFSCAALFQPALSFFDMVIHLNPGQVPRYDESTQFDAKRARFMRVTCQGQTKNVCRPISAGELNVFTTFMQVLQERVGSIALIFYDAFGGAVVGICFKPGALQEKPHPKVLCEKEYQFVSKERNGTVQFDPHVLASTLKTIFRALITDIEIKSA